MTRICLRATGVVSGGGRFVWRRSGPGRTRITWDERLRFPGGWAAWSPALVAAPVLRLMWPGNLRRLASLVENRAHG